MSKQLLLMSFEKSGLNWYRHGSTYVHLEGNVISVWQNGIRKFSDSINKKNKNSVLLAVNELANGSRKNLSFSR